MASFSFTFAFSLILIAFAIASATLSDEQFYATRCPKALEIIKNATIEAINNETRMGASLLRLHFHDCFVQGCDASVLLNGTTSEKFARPNNKSARGFGVIDTIKQRLEAVCPEVVSCADILAVVARDAVSILDGPCWKVQLGRRDSFNANQSAANTDIPAPSLNLPQLIQSFRNQSLSTADMVALSGAHTIGDARCTTFRSRIYNETNIDTKFASEKQKECPRTTGVGDNNLTGLDVISPYIFDNKYYVNVLYNKSQLHSDQQLMNTTTATEQVYQLVVEYARNQTRFFEDFANSMRKMGSIRVLTGKQGEVRKTCSKTN